MSVKLSISQSLPEGSTNQRLAEVDGSTVGECLNQLVKKFPNLKKWIFDEGGDLQEYLDIFINKEIAFPQKLSKPVKDGDELNILCTIGGG